VPQIIGVSDLVVVYSDGTKAVDGISFNVEEGEFFGFLGPNGAGKSTTIKVLTTLLRKTKGQVSVAGHNIDHDPQAIRKLIGVEAQEMVIDPDLTARENIILQGNLQQMKGNELFDRAEELLRLVELKHVADKPAGRFSGGMKKRLQLAASLVHKPRLLFLDEPTTGLDPQSRAGTWDYLEKLNKEGVTIFLTTQYLEEADRLCERLAIIDHGKLVASGTPAELKRGVGADTITLTLADGAKNGGAREVAKKVIASVAGIVDVQDSDGGLTAHARNASLAIADIVRALDENRIRLSAVSFSSPTLDDVFMQHTGRRIRVEELGRMPDSMLIRRGR
jgi:daunorubicin resistance ABC transporter ATP-binding subunit